MATASKTTNGFKVLCPECYEAEITIDLGNLVCTCSSCGESFTAEEARDKIAEKVCRWDHVVAWVESAREILKAE